MYGLVQEKCQPIFWTNDGPVYQCMYSPPGISIIFINIGSGNGFALAGDKQLPEPVIIQFIDKYIHH